jgi:hypothetical protein
MELSGRWAAKLVTHLLATSALWVRIQTSPKSTIGLYLCAVRLKSRLKRLTSFRERLAFFSERLERKKDRLFLNDSTIQYIRYSS